MDNINLTDLRQFYIDHLKDSILKFWVPASIDSEDGGYLNCFDNKGEKLLSHNKFTWSQGRFVWTFAKLASINADIFTDKQRNIFLEYSRQGAEFLRENVFIDSSYRCAFLMDKKGAHIPQGEKQIYDSSIFADCFVVGGFAKYAAVSKDKEYFNIAVKLYDSIIERIKSNNYNLMPYSCPKGYRMHSIPMICLNISNELFYASKAFGNDGSEFASDIGSYYLDILNNFVDENCMLHEMILQNNKFSDTLLGSYINPGHTIEDMWFILEACKTLGESSFNEKCFKITRNAIEYGWDKEYGGIQLFADKAGGTPKGSIKGIEDEPMLFQVRNNHYNKLWWVHSEALYTLLLCYFMSGDNYFLDAYNTIHNYTFKTFPNPDKTVGEWIQIRQRNGEPEDKVVALPVKDPYHITRNLIQVIELLTSH